MKIVKIQDVKGGNTVKVAITAQGMSDVASFNVSIIFDETIAKVVNVPANLSIKEGTLASDTQTPGLLKLGWFAYPGYDMSKPTELITIEFEKLKEGTAGLTFIKDGGFGVTGGANISDVKYENGSIAFVDVPQMPVKSNVKIRKSVVGYVSKQIPECCGNCGHNVSRRCKLGDFVPAKGGICNYYL
jgi:hypothetical protein